MGRNKGDDLLRRMEGRQRRGQWKGWLAGFSVRRGALDGGEGSGRGGGLEGLAF